MAFLQLNLLEHLVVGGCQGLHIPSPQVQTPTDFDQLLLFSEAPPPFLCALARAIPCSNGPSRSLLAGFPPAATLPCLNSTRTCASGWAFLSAHCPYNSLFSMSFLCLVPISYVSFPFPTPRVHSVPSTGGGGGGASVGAHPGMCHLRAPAGATGGASPPPAAMPVSS